MFSILDEIDDTPTIETLRKGKKKLREIAKLKIKIVLTEEEREKITQEAFWISLVYSNFKNIFINSRCSLECAIEKNVFSVTECPICMETFTASNTISFGCKHTICTNCITNMIKTKPCSTCPLCRAKINRFIIHLI